MKLRIVKYMKLKVAKKLLYFFIFFTYSILLLSILIYPSTYNLYSLIYNLLYQHIVIINNSNKS